MRLKRSTHPFRLTVLTAGTFLMLSGTSVLFRNRIAAQRSPAMNSGRPIDPPATGLPPLGQTAPPVVSDGGVSSQEEQERSRQMARDRDKRVAADVDKLVALSTELKSDVDKTNKDELSLDVIRKAREIEKLAHDVQSRMRN